MPGRCIRMDVVRKSRRTRFAAVTCAVTCAANSAPCHPSRRARMLRSLIGNVLGKFSCRTTFETLPQLTQGAFQSPTSREKAQRLTVKRGAHYEKGCYNCCPPGLYDERILVSSNVAEEQCDSSNDAERALIAAAGAHLSIEALLPLSGLIRAESRQPQQHRASAQGVGAPFQQAREIFGRAYHDDRVTRHFLT